MVLILAEGDGNPFVLENAEVRHQLADHGEPRHERARSDEEAVFGPAGDESGEAVILRSVIGLVTGSRIDVR